MTPEEIAVHTDKMNSELVLQLNRCDVAPRCTSIMKFQI